MHKLLVVLLAACSIVSAQTKPAARKKAPASDLQKKIARFAPVPLQVDTSKLSAGDKKALASLIQAARIYNKIFMEQMWSKNLATYARVKKSGNHAAAEYYWMNKSPWSDPDEHAAFISGVPERKLPGANFYPEDMTKDEFESWVKTLSDKDREAAIGFFTIIRREDGKLTIVPYSEAYKADLERCAKLLKDAAAATDNDTLKKFLETRAQAFLSNDYFDSDMAWMDLDAPLDITIGPYETYNDEIFGYKAAYEAYINLRDDKESQRLAFFGKHLQEIEDNLPIDPKYRTPKLGAAAPIRVVNEIYAAGDGAHGIKTAAYNLPNDDRVVQEKGSKRVMLKNVQEAKFKGTLIPISKVVLKPADQKYVDFEWFFTHIVAHELTHGLGPHQIKVDGRDTNPRFELKDLYSAIEEAKADVTGLFALQQLMSSGSAGKDLASGADAEHKLYTTYLASSFRTIRFGLQDAHAKGQAMQLNYLVDHGGVKINADGTFSVDFSKIKQAVSDLDHDLLTLEATGDYAGAKKMLDELSVVRPPVQKLLDKLKNVPIDIEPRFVTADRISPAKAGEYPTAP